MERHFRIRVIGLCLLFFSPLTTVCKAQDCCDNSECKRCTDLLTAPAVHGTSVVKIDGDTGTFQGRTRFPSGATVQIEVRINNPFRYDYAVGIAQTPLNEALANSFLKLIGIDLATLKAAGLDKGTRDDVSNKILAWIQQVQEAKAFVEKTQAEIVEAQQISLCKQAACLVNRRTALTQWDQVKQDLEKPENQTTKAKFATQIAEIDKVQKDLETLDQLLTTVLSRERLFYRTYVVGGDSEPSQVTVTITRSDLRNAGAPLVHTVRLQLGESPLTLTGGVGFSTVDEVRIVRQAGLVDGELGQVFGYESRSTVKPSAVILLSGKITRLAGTSRISPWNPTFALSLGLVVSNRAGETEAEFVMGPSFGFANDLLFVTTGYHVARVQKLGGGFNVGDPIPSGLNDPLPIQKNFRCGFMAALSFKIR